MNIELSKRLNLLANAPNFVFKETSDDSSAIVLSPRIIPGDGIYWVSGTTKLPGGREVESVFRVESSSGGDLLGVYWKVGDDWYEHDSAESFAALGITREQAFPFDWKCSIAIEGDVFHPQ